MVRNQWMGVYQNTLTMMGLSKFTVTMICSLMVVIQIA